MLEKKTIYHFIVDKSGSMQDVLEETITGYNEQLKKIRMTAEKYPDQQFSIGLTAFNNVIDHHYFDQPLKEARNLSRENYRPNNGTALLDAIGFTAVKLEELYQQSQNVDLSIVVVILTDGYENSSREFGNKEICRLVERLEQTDKWTFSFLGATMDAIQVAESINIKTRNSARYSKLSMKEELWDRLSSSYDTYASKRQRGEKLDQFLDDKI